MNSEFEGVLKKEREALTSSPKIFLMVAVVFLLFGILLLALDVISPNASRVAALCGACFGIVALAFAAHLRSAQSKLNLEIVKAIRDLSAEPGKGK